MKIPSNNQWTQTNEGEILGVLGETKNISLNTPGFASGARKSVALFSDLQVGSTFFGVPVAIQHYDDEYYVITTEKVYTTSLDGQHPAQKTALNQDYTYSSDALQFNGKLMITLSGNLTSWDGTTQVTGLASLTAGVPHPMAIFDRLPTYKLAIGDGNTVKTYSTSYIVNPTVLTLPAGFQVTTLKYRNGFLYVGTKNIYGGEARIFLWNGTGTEAQYGIPVGAPWVFSMVEYGLSVAAIISSGQLGMVNGSSFQQLSALPIFYNDNATWQLAAGQTVNGKVLHRGMVVDGDTIYVNLSGRPDVGFDPRMKSGLWAFNAANGFNHIAAHGSDYMLPDNGLSRSGDELTTFSTHNLVTGDSVLFPALSGLTGVSVNTTYYVTVTASNKVKLSESRRAVDAGRFISLGGTPNSGDYMTYFPNEDHGASYSSAAAITVATAETSRPSYFGNRLLFSGQTISPDNNIYNVLNVLTDQYSISRLETQRIYSNNITQSWKYLYTFLDGLKYSGESFTVKIKTEDKVSEKVLNGAWLSSTIINTTFGDIDEGDELIIVEGNGQGRAVHVTKVESSASVHSLTVDEAIGTAGDTSSFFVSGFKKVDTFTNDTNLKGYIRALLQSVNSPWIKIAIEMRGFTPSCAMFDMSNEINTGSN